MKKEYNIRSLKKRAGKPRVSADAAKVAISLRLDGSDLAQLKSEAARLGMPYQTLLGSILHQYVSGDLVEKKTVTLLQKIHKATSSV